MTFTISFFSFVCFIYFVTQKKYCSKVCCDSKYSNESDSKYIYNVTNISKLMLLF